MDHKGVASICMPPRLGPLGGPISQGSDDDGERSLRGWNARLEEVIRERIVPRLVLVHKVASAPDQSPGPQPDDIAEFGQLVVATDPGAAELFFARMHERGFSAESLFETLLAPTARHLGELWEADLCDFVDVSIGVGRLQTLLETFSRAPSLTVDAQRRTLLIATPGDQHLFGLDVIASFLRISGWEVLIEKGLSTEQNADTVSSQWIAVAGVTMGREASLDVVARTIDAVRRASLNPAISVMVGGIVFKGRPDLVVRVGADAMAHDGPSAALLARRLYLDQSAARAH